MCWSNIREFFWPLLEPKKDNENDNAIQNKQILAKQPEHLKIALELALRNYDSETERIKTVESKSIIFIGIIGLITTIVITLATNFFLKKHIVYDIKTVLFLLLVWGLMVYLTRTLWFSIRCLERKAYYVIDESLYNKSDDNYLSEIISNITAITNENSRVINEKVDHMVLSQEYFKRAIGVVAIYLILSFISIMFPLLCRLCFLYNQN